MKEHIRIPDFLMTEDDGTVRVTFNTIPEVIIEFVRRFVSMIQDRKDNTFIMIDPLEEYQITQIKEAVTAIIKERLARRTTRQ